MFDACRKLSDNQLLGALEKLMQTRHEGLARVLAHISEVEARRLFRIRGCSSMFTYCVEVLRMSEDEAYKRIRVARLGRRFPMVLEEIGGARVTLTSAYMLTGHLTDGNHREVLARARGLKKPQVEMLIAELAPRPDVPSSVEPVAEPAPPSAAASPIAVETLARAVDARRVFEEAVARRGVAREEETKASGRVKPLSPERFEFRFTGSAGMRDKLQRAADLLGHRVTKGDLEAIIDRALTSLVEELEKSKLGKSARPRAQRPRQKPGSRHIPAAVRREVAERDELRCSFVAPDGRQCSETSALQFDHQELFAREKNHRATNIRFMCGPHNQLLAEQQLGDDYMAARRTHASHLPPEPTGPA